MASLSYDQKKALIAYERFFGDKYDTQGRETGNTDEHIQAQKMCYLLKIAGIEIGDFDYSWNFKGPFSPGLLALLRSIDRKHQEVTNFYEHASEQSWLLPEQKEMIDGLKDYLEISTHQTQRMQWVEILGSMAYISRTLLPGAGFETVNQKLMKEKPEYSDEQENMHAWNLLNNANLLSTLVAP